MSIDFARLDHAVRVVLPQRLRATWPALARRCERTRTANVTLATSEEAA